MYMIKSHLCFIIPSKVSMPKSQISSSMFTSVSHVDFLYDLDP